MNIEKKKQNPYEYYSLRLPQYLKDGFEKEKKNLTDEVMAKFQKAMLEQDFMALANEVQTDLMKLAKLYGLSQSNKKKIMLICLDYLFQKGGFSNTNSNIIFNILKITFRLGVKIREKIDWRILFDIFRERFLKNDLEILYPNTWYNLWIFRSVLRVVKYSKRNFTDESVQEVYDLFKQFIYPSNMHLGVFVLYNFLRIDNQGPLQVYQKILDELVEMWSWRQFAVYEQLIYALLYKFLQIRALDWTKYLDKIFSSFQYQIMQVLPSSSGKNRIVPKNLNPFWIQNRSTYLQSAEIMVCLVVGSQSPHFENIWERIEVLLKLQKPFVHPQSSSYASAQQIFDFIYIFCVQYVRRVESEEKFLERYAQIFGEPEKNARKKNDDLFLDDEFQSDFESSYTQGVGQSGAAGGQSAFGNAPKESSSVDKEIEEEEKNELEAEIESDSEEEGDDTPAEERAARRREKYQKIRTDYEPKFLDEAAHARFIDLMLEFVRLMIFQKDNKYGSVRRLVKTLARFRPQRTIPVLLPQIFEVLERTDMKFTTVVQILTYLVTPLLDRRQFPEGLFYIPEIIRRTKHFLSPSDLELSRQTWKLYTRIFVFVPVRDPNDLFEQWCLEFPQEKSNYDRFRQFVNGGADPDPAQEALAQFYRRYADESQDVFRRYLEILHFIEKEKSLRESNQSGILVSVHNHYLSLVSGASPTVFEYLLSVSLAAIRGQIQLKAQKNYSYLIHAFVLRDAERVVPRLLTFVFDQVLRRRKQEPALETGADDPSSFHFLLRENPDRARVLEYQLEDLNEKSLLYYLDFLEDVVSFAGARLIPHDLLLQQVILNALLHEDHQIFTKATKIVHKLLLSLLSLYTRDFAHSVDQEGTTATHRYRYHQIAGDYDFESFRVLWHEPTPEEVEYARLWVQRLWAPVHAHLSSTLLSELPADSRLDLSSSERFIQVIHQIQTQPESSHPGKLTIKKSLQLLDQVLGGIIHRADRFNLLNSEAPENQEAREFVRAFSFEPLRAPVREMREFVERLSRFLIEKNLIQNVMITEKLVTLLTQFGGVDNSDWRVIHTAQWCSEYMKTFRDSRKKRQNEPRFLNLFLATHNLYLRLESQTSCVRHLQSDDFVTRLTYLLIYHPYQKIASEGFQALLDLRMRQRDERAFQRMVLSQLTDYMNDCYRTIFRANVDKAELQASLEAQQSIAILVFGTVTQRFFELYYMNFDVDLVAPIVEVFWKQTQIENLKSRAKMMQNYKSVYMILIDRANKLNRFQVLEGAQQRRFFVEQVRHAEFQEFLQRPYSFQHVLAHQQEIRAQLLLFDVALTQSLRGIDPNLPEQLKLAYFSSFFQFMTACFYHKSFPDWAEKLQIQTDFLVLSDYSIRNLAKCIIFRILRHKLHDLKSKRRVKIDSSYHSSYSEEDYLRYHFEAKDVDLSMTRKQLLGLYAPFQEYEETVYDLERLAAGREDYLGEKLRGDREFCLKFMEILYYDVNAVENNAAGVQLRQRFAFMQKPYQTVNTFANLDLGKSNLFYIWSNIDQFDGRFLKKLFQVYGYEFFRNTKDYLVEQHLQDLHKKESQNFANIYLTGLYKSLLTQSALTAEQREEMETFAVENLVRCILFSSFEVIQSWLKALNQFFYYKAAGGINARLVQHLFQHPSYLNKDDQYNRIILIFTIYICDLGSLSRDIAERYLDEFLTRDPSDQKQVYFLFDLLQNSIYKVYISYLNSEAISTSRVDSFQHLVRDTSFALVERNPKLQRVFQHFVHQYYHHPDKKQKLNYANFISCCLHLFSEEKIGPNFLYYLEPILQFHIEFKEEDLEDQNLIQKFQSNLISLSYLTYQQDSVKQVWEIALKGLKNSSWRVRLRAIVFIENFVYSNTFLLKDIEFIDPVLEFLTDENSNVSGKAQKTLSDLFRIQPIKKLQGYFEILQKLAEPKEKDEKKRKTGVLGLMSLMETNQHEVRGYMEKSLRLILKGKKLTGIKEKLKTFASNFLKSTFADQIHNLEDVVSEDTLSDLREISNPYNYFA